MLLTVNEIGQVEYIGRVSASQSTLGVSPAAVADIDPESLALDEVVVVEGWLTGVGWLDCSLENAGVSIEPGLPQRYCFHHDSWIADVPYGFGRDGLRVQSAAYFAFAADPSHRVADEHTVAPRWGRYAVARRLEGWCGGAQPPCWQWQIVARVDSNEGRTSTPAPSPSVGPAQIECGTAQLSDPQVSIYDQTGLVISCQPFAHADPASIAGTRVTNPDGNLRILQIDWTSNVGCSPSASFTLSLGGSMYRLSGEITTYAECRLLIVSHSVRLTLRADLPAQQVEVGEVGWTLPNPSPAPTDLGARTLICAAPEALGDSGITLVDHSGRIDGCSMARPDVITDAPIEVSTTQVPGQLAVDWTINTGCPDDEEMEFRGPLKQPIGLADYVLQVARRSLPGETCNDLVAVRRVQLSLTEPMRPSEI